MKISQKQLADKLDLSVSTVSRALLADPRIPQETRVRVLSFAARAGYRLKKKNEFHIALPNGPSAVNRETGKSLMIAAFVQAEDLAGSENASKSIVGMGQAAQEFNISLVLYPIPFKDRALIHLPEKQPEVVRSGKVQGVILVNSFDPEAVDRLARQITCVSVDIWYSGLAMDCVGEENFESISKVVRHLVSLGHRKIGYVDEGYEISITRERRGGYINAMMEADLAVEPRYILRWQDRKSAPDGLGFEIFHRWIQEGVTGIVCVGDRTAIAVFQWLTANNYQCPGQVSITGFDAMTPPPGVPPITTLKVHFQDLGRLAVEKLVSRLKEPTLPPVRVMVECDLIIGKTTGPAPVKK
jgi:DNA-binding LacI/PurR family transcriptional regulator